MMIKKIFGGQPIILILFPSIFLVYSGIFSFNFNKITILTKSIGSSSGISGHPAVIRSLITGISSLGVAFNYNPSKEVEVGDTVIVLSNIQALQQAILLKKRGRIKCLLAGPNLVVWPTDDNKIITSPEVDVIIVPSEPTRHMYVEISPTIKNRIHVWYAGVNIDFWKPSKIIKNRNVLVYCKNQQEGVDLKNSVISILKKYGWIPILIEYGRYDHQRYKEVLDSCLFAVFLSRSESQGIALAEAWSMNIPTLPWNPKERFFRGRQYSAVSSCPYLSCQTGVDWKDTAEFCDVLSRIDSIIVQFRPRDWVLEHMTDKHSAQNMLNLISSI